MDIYAKKNFAIFLVKFWVVLVAGAITPPHHLSSIFDSITDRVKKLYLKCMSMDIEVGNTEV